MTQRIALVCAAAAFGFLVGAHPAGAQVPIQKAAPAAPAPAAPQAANAVPPVPPPVPVLLAMNEAIPRAVKVLMSTVAEPQAGEISELVIDPLIDGRSGYQNASTVTMGNTIAQLIKQNNPRFKVVAFTPDAIAKKPLVLVGTFRPVNIKNRFAAPVPADAYLICLTLLDLKSGKVVGRSITPVKPNAINVTPTSFYQDAPVWSADPMTAAYIKLCQTTSVGDPIDPVYADRIVLSSLIAEATNAYNARRYRDALDLYKSALRTPGGDQLRVNNGIYLANMRLKRAEDAKAAFDTIVDRGLGASKLAVNFLFTSGSTLFYSPKGESMPYGMWLKEIAARAAAAHSCLEIVGHTSKSGLPAINDRLSALRAQYVRDRLIDTAPALGNRSLATGVGSRETIVGTEKDGPDNAVDRRVEFKPIKCEA